MDDRLENKYSLLDNDFKDVWCSNDFSLPFSEYYSDDLYKNLTPCNKCRFLKDICYPCHLLIDKETESEMTLCKFMYDEIKRREHEIE